MTSNRARKRAARAIAADKNIRHPEAFAMADDKVVPSERSRPKEYTPSADPNDPELARMAAESNSMRLMLAPGVIGSRTPGIEEMVHIINQAHGFDEADAADIRRPDAVYQTDHRTLLIDDFGTLYFAKGPQRLIGDETTAKYFMADVIAAYAKQKQWSIIELDMLKAADTPEVLASLKGQPSLVVISGPVWPPLNPFAVMLAEGSRPDINVLVVREPLPGETEDTIAETGHNVFFISARTREDWVDPELEAPKPPRPNVALTRARIDFSLRYASLLESGVNNIASLESVADEMLGMGTPEATAVGEVAAAAGPVLRTGVWDDFWKDHQEVLGAHLVRMMLRGFASGDLDSALRSAAATLEADLRIGMAS
jgi:hypothetical protein